VLPRIHAFPRNAAAAWSRRIKGKLSRLGRDDKTTLRDTALANFGFVRRAERRPSQPSSMREPPGRRPAAVLFAFEDHQNQQR